MQAYSGHVGAGTLCSPNSPAISQDPVPLLAQGLAGTPCSPTSPAVGQLGTWWLGGEELQGRLGR